MVFGPEMMRDTVFGVVGHFESAKRDGLGVHVIDSSLALITTLISRTTQKARKMPWEIAKEFDPSQATFSVPGVPKPNWS